MILIVLTLLYLIKQDKEPVVALLCFVVGITIAIELNFISGFSIASYLSQTITVLGIIASAALLVTMEFRKDEKFKKLTLGFLLSGLMFLMSVLVGLILLYQYNNPIYTTLLVGLFIGTLFLSFALLFVGLVSFGIYFRLDELNYLKSFK